MPKQTDETKRKKKTTQKKSASKAKTNVKQTQKQGVNVVVNSYNKPRRQRTTPLQPVNPFAKMPITYSLPLPHVQPLEHMNQQLREIHSTLMQQGVQRQATVSPVPAPPSLRMVDTVGNAVYGTPLPSVERRRERHAAAREREAHPDEITPASTPASSPVSTPRSQAYSSASPARNILSSHRLKEVQSSLPSSTATTPRANLNQAFDEQYNNQQFETQSATSPPSDSALSAATFQVSAVVGPSVLVDMPFREKDTQTTNEQLLDFKAQRKLPPPIKPGHRAMDLEGMPPKAGMKDAVSVTNQNPPDYANLRFGNNRPFVKKFNTREVSLDPFYSGPGVDVYQGEKSLLKERRRASNI